MLLKLESEESESAMQKIFNRIRIRRFFGKIVIPEKYTQKLYNVFPYMNTHYFHFINQTQSLKLNAHFTAISFQKAVVLHFFIRIRYCFFNGF